MTLTRENELHTHPHRAKRRVRQTLAVLGLTGLAAAPAYAQIAAATTVMTNIQTVLTGLAVVMFTIAIMWVGYKMIFQHAKWSEVSNIMIGGILVGGAAAIAAWLV
jgi:type IV secretion system protein VirB2